MLPLSTPPCPVLSLSADYPVISSAPAAPVLDLDAVLPRRSRGRPTPTSSPAVIRPEAVPALARDFPAIAKPGYLTVDEVALSGRFGDLVAELEGDAVSRCWARSSGSTLVSHPG